MRRDVVSDVRRQLGADYVGDDPPAAADDGELTGLRCSTPCCFDVDCHDGFNLPGHEVALRREP